MLKKIVAAALIPACSVPIALSGSEEKKIIDLSDIKKPRLNYQKSRNVRDFVSFIKKAGYSRKPTESLVDFNSGRGLGAGDNTGLGCYRTIFAGKNYLRLHDPENYQIGYHSRTFDLNEEGPIIACATAARRKTKTNQGMYELEFSVKKGNEGFVEKVFVLESWIISQLIKFEKNFGSNAKEHPYVQTIGFQRNIRQSEFADKEWKWQIANPENNSWQDLKLDDVEEKEPPIFYSVWVEGNSSEGIFDNLGVKDKKDNKWFSGLISEDKTQNENKWFSSFDVENKHTARVFPRNRFYFYKYENLVNVARTLEKSKGNWQKIKSFCETYKNERDKSKKLSVTQQIQLQEYCYHKK